MVRKFSLVVIFLQLSFCYVLSYFSVRLYSDNNFEEGSRLHCSGGGHANLNYGKQHGELTEFFCTEMNKTQILKMNSV